MLFNFVVNDMRTLINAATAVGMVDTMADVTFSPEMLCIMADSYVSIKAAIGIQLWPPFFDHYFCINNLQRSWFYLTKIFPLTLELLDSGYTSFTFSIIEPYEERAKLKFEGPNGLLHEIEFKLYYSHHPLYVGEFDLSVFVSLDSQEFSSIVDEYHMFDYVHVTITSTRVTFSYAIVQETILTPQDGQCLIGGVRAPNQIQFIITLAPAEVFYHIAGEAKRIWFFKAFNSTKGVITAPIGLNGRLVAFFCDVFAEST
ncbi:uncharacterized protein LOC120068348 [Benincasa hispida]|uniref:uncharacterized protein LOC120068348 n=1 Tax=Benincasa hispida TaxID=102211 RepID=UPI0018FFF8EF|nr:uncharacterized protein LOC120068348 [Benincasa hispida]